MNYYSLCTVCLVVSNWHVATDTAVAKLEHALYALSEEEIRGVEGNSK